MKPITHQLLERWLNPQPWPCVTIYLPTSASGDAVRAGPIRLKNLLVRAEQKLVVHGSAEKDAHKLLRPAWQLVDDERFWTDQAQGLALLLTAEGMETWRLPREVPETVAVGRRACLKPMLPIVTDNRPFYLLAVSQKQVRLYQGDRWQLNAVEGASLPPGLVEALNYQAPQGLVHVLGASAGGRGSEGTVYHGQGGEVDRHKDELLAWFRMIDRALHAHLRSERAPLIFAGVQYLYPIYRLANTYPHLFDRAVQGNPERWSRDELHRQAVELLGPLWTQAMTLDRVRLSNRLGSDHVSAAIEEVLPAAIEGRVDTLFVDREHALWGRCDAPDHAVVLLDEMSPASEDLLDRAAFEVLKHRGRVYAVAADEVPGGIALAALYRHAMPGP